MRDNAIRNERLAVRYCEKHSLQQAHLQILFSVHMNWSPSIDSFVPATGVLQGDIGRRWTESFLNFYASLK